MTTRIDLKRMRYVIEVARAESITRAAEVLGVTQSALSRSIAAVEDGVGVALFQRLPRGIHLTEAGERFVRGARRLLRDADRFVADFADPGELAGGHLRIGVAPRAFVDQVSRPLVKFAQAHPRVAIEVVTGTAQSLCPRLLGGELDVIVGVGSYLQRWRELRLQTLKRLLSACLVRVGHPLTRLPQPPSERDVLAYPVIIPEGVEPIYTHLAQRFVDLGLPPFQPQYVVADDATVGRLLKRTDAVYPTHVPDLAAIAADFTAILDALRVPPQFIAMALPAARPPSTAAARFEQLMIEETAEPELAG